MRVRMNNLIAKLNTQIPKVATNIAKPDKINHIAKSIDKFTK